MLPRQKEKMKHLILPQLNVDTDQTDTEKKISSLVTIFLCFSYSLTFGAFFVCLHNLPWYGAVCLKEPRGYTFIYFFSLNS